MLRIVDEVTSPNYITDNFMTHQHNKNLWHVFFNESKKFVLECFSPVIAFARWVLRSLRK